MTSTITIAIAEIALLTPALGWFIVRIVKRSRRLSRLHDEDTDPVDQ